MLNPIFTGSNAEASNSVPLNHRHIEMLKDVNQVDEWSTFTEGGWFCILGYKNGRQVLYAHCKKSSDFKIMMNPSKGNLDNYGHYA